MKGRNTSFIKHINVAGALHKPNDITNHSYRPFLVLKDVFQVSSSFTHTCWYLDLRSNLVKHFACCNLSNKSSIMGRDCQFLSVILFKALQSMCILQVPSLATMMIGDTQGEVLGRITHCSNIYCTYFFTSSTLMMSFLYNPMFGNRDSSNH